MVLAGGITPVLLALYYERQLREDYLFKSQHHLEKYPAWKDAHQSYQRIIELKVDFGVRGILQIEALKLYLES